MIIFFRFSAYKFTYDKITGKQKFSSGQKHIYFLEKEKLSRMKEDEFSAAF